MANGKMKNGHVTNGTVTSADTKSINGTVKNGYIAAESDVRQRQIRNQHKTDEKHETLTTETDKDTTITGKKYRGVQNGESDFEEKRRLTLGQLRTQSTVA